MSLERPVPFPARDGARSSRRIMTGKPQASPMPADSQSSVRGPLPGVVIDPSGRRSAMPTRQRDWTLNPMISFGPSTISCRPPGPGSLSFMGSFKPCNHRPPRASPPSQVSGARPLLLRTGPVWRLQEHRSRSGTVQRLARRDAAGLGSSLPHRDLPDHSSRSPSPAGCRSQPAPVLRSVPPTRLHAIAAPPARSRTPRCTAGRSSSCKPWQNGGRQSTERRVVCCAGCDI